MILVQNFIHWPFIYLWDFWWRVNRKIKHKCTVCDFETMYLKTLNYHRTKKHGVKAINCPMPGCKFKSIVLSPAPAGWTFFIAPTSSSPKINAMHPNVALRIHRLAIIGGVNSQLDCCRCCAASTRLRFFSGLNVPSRISWTCSGVGRTSRLVFA